MDTIQFSRSILNKPMVQRISSAIQSAGSLGSVFYGPNILRPYLIEAAACVTTIRNNSSTHVSVLVYEMVPRENVIRFALSGSSVDLNAAYDDGENTMQLFRTRDSPGLLPFNNYNNGGQEIIPVDGPSVPTIIPNASENTVIPDIQKLPLGYGPFDCLRLKLLYKISKPRVTTLAPDGTLTITLRQSRPRFWNPNKYVGNWDPYDYRTLTKTHFVRVIPERHCAETVALGSVVPLVLDPMQVSVQSTFSFTCRAPFDLAPLRSRGEVSRVGPGRYMNESQGVATTQAVHYDRAGNQGVVTIPTAP